MEKCQQWPQLTNCKKEFEYSMFVIYSAYNSISPMDLNISVRTLSKISMCFY